MKGVTIRDFTRIRGINQNCPSKPGHMATLEIRGLKPRPIYCSSQFPGRDTVEPQLTSLAARSGSRLEEEGWSKQSSEQYLQISRSGVSAQTQGPSKCRPEVHLRADIHSSG